MVDVATIADRFAISVAVGAYTNAGGGLFVRFCLADLSHRFLAIPCPILFDLLDTLNAIIEKRGHHDDTRLDDAIAAYKRHRPKIVPSDFEQIRPSDAVTEIRGDEFENAVALYPRFMDGPGETILLRDALLHTVRGLFQDAIAKAGLTRPSGRIGH